MNSLTTVLWLALNSFLVIHATNICRSNCKVEFETKGCYRDTSARTLPHYIYNERDPTISNYGGRSIDWYNWNEYYTGFVCRCAEKAKELGFDLFGVQFYGECWAGYSGVHNYAMYGSDYTWSGCIQDDYQPCTKFSRYCIGHQWRNMVYQIVDTSCPQVSFEKVDCFKDDHDIDYSNRPLPDYLFNDRDVSIPNYSGQRIDWINWDTYVPKFACRCAAAAKAHNATFFGMQFYGECWSGQNGHLTYDRDGSSINCIDQCGEPCTKHSKFCSGQNFANYVYKIKDGSCEVDVTPVGCYSEDTNDAVMDDIFYNEAEPGMPNYGGKMLQFSQDYNADFAEFLCKCARVAHHNKWEYFGVRERGLCVRSTEGTNYDKFGPTDQCYEGDASKPCPSGSKLCAGFTHNANYVYKITLAQ